MRKMTAEQFERLEVFKPRGLKHALHPTGYEAFRVSPRTTRKYGRRYKRIYGATIEPDYRRKIGERYGATVKWYPHGYTTEKARSGTRMIMRLSDYPVDREQARMLLMLSDKKHKTR